MIFLSQLRLVVGENFTCTETEVQNLKSQIELDELVIKSIVNLRAACSNKKCGGERVDLWKRDFPCDTLSVLQDNLSLRRLENLISQSC